MPSKTGLTKGRLKKNWNAFRLVCPFVSCKSFRNLWTSCRDQNYFVYKFQAEGFYIFGGIIWARWQVFEDTFFFVWWFHRRAHTFDGTCPFAFHGLLNRRSGGIFHKTHIYDQSEHIVQNIYMQSLEITVLLGRYSSRSIPIIMLRWNGNWCFTVKHPLEQNCRSITDLHTPSILIFDNRKEKTSK